MAWRVRLQRGWAVRGMVREFRYGSRSQFGTVAWQEDVARPVIDDSPTGLLVAQWQRSVLAAWWAGGAMASQGPFEVEVSCGAASAGHDHVLVIAEDDWISFGAMPSRPVVGGAKRQIEFVCPVSGERRTAEFEPPAGYRWPFTVVSIE